MLVLILAACAHAPPPADFLPVELLALSAVEAQAPGAAQAAADREDVAGCVAWALVGSAAGVAHALLPAAELGQPATEIPAVTVDLTPCDGVPIDQVLDVSAAVDHGLLVVGDALPLLHCPAQHVASEVLVWAHTAATAIPPQADGWTVAIPATPITPAVCP